MVTMSSKTTLGTVRGEIPERISVRRQPRFRELRHGLVSGFHADDRRPRPVPVAAVARLLVETVQR
jgi:hypothetical protein